MRVFPFDETLRRTKRRTTRESMHTSRASNVQTSLQASLFPKSACVRPQSGMFGWRGGTGIDMYGGGLRRRIVWSNITRTGRVSSDATDASPVGDTPTQFRVWRPFGRTRRAEFDLKQLLLPDPSASARSARPLPLTTFRHTRFPRGRQGGPGSRAPGSKTTNRAVGKTAMP